jgi:hypothetical protein
LGRKQSSWGRYVPIHIAYMKGDVMTQSEPTVFIADDDPSVIKGLCLLMKSVKLNVETYSSAQDLLDSDNPDQPGCLLIGMGSQNRLSVRTKRVYRENPIGHKGKTLLVFCNFFR